MTNIEIQTIYDEIQAGIQLQKCKQCGCMRETLQNLATSLPTVNTEEADTLAEKVAEWSSLLAPERYSCLGCDHCYPAVAQNAAITAFPIIGTVSILSCDFQTRPQTWPAVVGEYIVIDNQASVAVSTLASVNLVDELARLRPAGLAIVGKTETENIGVDKIIKNIITNTRIHFLIVAGKESEGHESGKTLLALAENGVSPDGRVIGSPGKHPVLRNVSSGEVNAFRKQVRVIDLVGCEDSQTIAAQVEELSHQAVASCSCSECSEPLLQVALPNIPATQATDLEQPVRMDKAGYFVILPQADHGTITVEHYAYDNTMLHVIEGANAHTLYKTIIAQGWVTELSHAGYLGMELAKAELSLRHGFPYVQDGA